MPAWRVGHHDDWPTLGWDLIDWVEAYLCHGPGDVEGELVELDDEWAQVLLDLYRLYPKGHDRAGHRVVTRGVLSRAKGRAKSELAGMIVCIEARAPARFDGWTKSGEPVGRPVRSPFIRALATEESQAGNTYDNVTVMLDHAARHHADVFGGIDIGKSTQASTRIYLPGGGEIRPSTASSAAKDGGKETFGVADETHLYVLPEHRGMHRTVSRNLRKRKIAEPWMLDTTTAHRPGQGSVAELAHDRARTLLDGRRARAGGFYMNHREGLEVEDWKDDGQVLASLAEAYGAAAEWVDRELILTDDIRSPDATEVDSRRYWLNQVRAGSEQAFDPERWSQLAKADVVVPKKELITLGFVGARVEDPTALIATWVAEGYQWPVGIWERPEDAPEDWEVDEAAVEAAVEEAFSTWDVWRMYANPSYWESPIDRWAGKWGDKKVIRWWTNRDRAMAFAVRAFDTSQKTGELSHPAGETDNVKAFDRHLGNCYRRDTTVKDDQGKTMWALRKEHPSSPNKIAAAVAATLSWEARGDAIASGALEKKRYRVAGF